jgi:hypothetical protein
VPRVCLTHACNARLFPLTGFSSYHISLCSLILLHVISTYTCPFSFDPYFSYLLQFHCTPNTPFSFPFVLSSVDPPLSIKCDVPYALAPSLTSTPVSLPFRPFSFSCLVLHFDPAIHDKELQRLLHVSKSSQCLSILRVFRVFFILLFVCAQLCLVSRSFYCIF